MNRFAANLGVLMERRRWSQRELAAFVGYSQPMVSKWVRGVNNPDFEQVAKIAEAFQVTVDMLILTDLAKVTDREIELRRSLARAVETVGVEESIRRLLVPGPAADQKPVEDVMTAPGPRKARKGGRGVG